MPICNFSEIIFSLEIATVTTDFINLHITKSSIEEMLSSHDIFQRQLMFIKI